MRFPISNGSQLQVNILKYELQSTSYAVLLGTLFIKVVFARSWYKEAGLSLLLDFRNSRTADIKHIVELIQMFQVCPTITEFKIIWLYQPIMC